MNEIGINDLTPDEEAALGRAVRDALSDEGAAFAPLPLDTDLWRRGRSAGRAHLAQVVAAAAVLLAMLFGLGAVTLPDLAPTQVPRGGALPQVIHVPGLDSDEWNEHLSDTLPRGRASVAGAVGSDVVLVIGAADGVHHLVRVPNLDTASDLWGSAGGLALSPDGWHLAYGWLEATGLGEREAGIAVADLRTGETVRTPFGPAGASGERLAQLAWSPDSSTLAWAAAAFADGEQGAALTTLGFGTPSAPVTASNPVPKGTIDEDLSLGAAMAVSDHGMLAVATSETLSLFTRADSPDDAWSFSGTRRFTVAQEYVEVAGAVFTDAATRLSLGITHGTLTFDVADLAAAPKDAEVEGTRRGWRQASDSSSTLRLVGASPSGTLLGVIANSSDGSVDTLVWAAEEDVRAERSLVRQEPYADAAGLRYATDLADTDPARFPPPAWADRGPWLFWFLAGSVVAALVLAVLLARGRRGLAPPGHREFADQRDLWDHRARRRAIGRTVRSTTAAVVLIGLFLALLWPLRPYNGPQVSQPGALPSLVEAAPASLQDRLPDDSRVSTQLTTGRLSVVTAISEHVFRGVGAQDGAQHVFAFLADGWLAAAPRQEVFALSPDGTRMASQMIDLGATTAESTSGIRIHDLVAGTHEDLPLVGEAGRPAVVEELAWSADGSHLAWVADEMIQLDQGATVWKGSARLLGVIRVDDLTLTSWRVPKATGNRALAVGNDGTARLVLGDELVTARLGSPDARPERRSVGGLVADWTGAVIAPSGERLVLGTGAETNTSLVDTGLRTLDLTDLEGSFELHPWTTPGPGGETHPLGWSPAGDLVLAVAGDGSRDDADTRIGVLREEAVGVRFTARTTVVGAGPESQVSVATALVDAPALDPGPARWPVTVERIAITALVGLLALASLVRAVVIARRNSAGL